MSFIKWPTVLQIVGVLIFGLAVWKGVHGFFPTAGLILGAGMAYVGRHYATLWK
jgi:type IV secretory pathway VirB2 component (pilin)